MEVNHVLGSSGWCLALSSKLWALLESCSKSLQRPLRCSVLEARMVRKDMTHKPPDPIFLLNSTSKAVMVHLSNSTTVPLVMERFSRLCEKNCRSRWLKFWSSRRCSAAIIACMFLSEASAKCYWTRYNMNVKLIHSTLSSAAYDSSQVDEIGLLTDADQHLWLRHSVTANHGRRAGPISTAVALGLWGGCKE